MWTTKQGDAGTDGDVRFRLIGDVCQTGWHELDHAWPYDDYQRGARNAYTFPDNDIGSEVK